jgi:exosortase
MSESLLSSGESGTMAEQSAQDGQPMRLPAHSRLSQIALSVCLGCVAWAYWPAFKVMAEKWSTDPQYSHGYFVPVFAAWLVWYRRGQLATAPWTPSAWGIPLLATGAAIYLTGAYVYFDWLEVVSLLVTLLGVSVLAGGWTLARWAAPAIGFLAFMMPLPHRFELMLAGPLRRVATLGSTYVLQTIGLPAVAEGNVILIEELRIGVAEACSGLSMLMTFFALATAFVIITKGYWVDKLVLVLSAIPIALLANVARIVVASILHQTVGSQAGQFFHDVLAPWFMMPLALALLWLELWFIGRLLPQSAPRRPMVLSLSGGKKPQRSRGGLEKASAGS